MAADRKITNGFLDTTPVQRPRTIQRRRAPLNRTKTIQLKEAIDFARENGYLYAVYEKREDGNYYLINEAYLSDISETTPIIVKTDGSGTSFNEFTTADKTHCFRLHNNFNLPNMIHGLSIKTLR